MREPNWKSYAIVTPQPILTPQQCQELIHTGQSEPKVILVGYLLIKLQIHIKLLWIGCIKPILISLLLTICK